MVANSTMGSSRLERLTLTVEETADVLGLSRNIVYNAIRRGEIPALKIGRRVVVPRAALMALLRESAEGLPDMEGR